MKAIIAAIVLICVLAAAPAGAQGTKVAVVDTAKVFNQMRETRDLKVKLDADRKTIEQTDRQKGEEVRAKKDARDQLKPDSPQFQARNEEYLKAAIEYKAWQEMTKMEMDRAQKTQIRSLYGKIQEAVNAVAKDRGLDLVLVQTTIDFPPSVDQITVEQLNRLISQQNVLYVSPSADISTDVIAKLDATYPAPAGQ